MCAFQGSKLTEWLSGERATLSGYRAFLPIALTLIEIVADRRAENPDAERYIRPGGHVTECPGRPHSSTSRYSRPRAC